MDNPAPDTSDIISGQKGQTSNATTKNDIPPIPFHQKVHDLCKEHFAGKIDHFAEITGISRKQLRRIIHGKTKCPHEATLEQIASAFYGYEDIAPLIQGTSLEPYYRHLTGTEISLKIEPKPLNIGPPPELPIGVEKPNQTLCIDLPQPVPFCFYHGEEALDIICEKVYNAKMVLNTTISKKLIKQTPGLLKWRKAAVDVICKGVYFVDIITSPWLGIARRRMAAVLKAKHTEKSKVIYQCVCLKCGLLSFMNFSVFEYKDNTKEVFFGWLVSPPERLTHSCLATKDPRVVNLFQTWHGYLFSSGTDVFKRKPGAIT